jgi:hypothetical protein
MRLAYAVLGAVALVAIIVIGMMFGIPAYGRYQARANAHNQTITARKHVQIERLKALARYQASIGLRRAQDEIRKTLTPLYVQFEMVQALQGIATSGHNATVIYLPTDPRPDCLWCQRQTQSIL